jgi:hypothetical protein
MKIIEGEMGIFTKKKRFVLSDQSENSYGFVVSTKGIDTARFESNPVMLDGHINQNESVLGAWDDVIVDKNDRLTALPVFDTDDDRVKKIAAKVESGFIRGASIGISFNPADMKKVGQQLVLTKCELLEASIVAVPSNKNALRLYNPEGKLLGDDEVNRLCMSLNSNNTNFENQMDKPTMQLSLTALAVLGFEATQVEHLQASDINAAVLALHQKNESLSQKVKDFETKEQLANDAEKARLALRNTSLVDAAIRSGRITADQRAHFLKMAEFDFELAQKHLQSETGKVSLGSELHPITGKEMTMEEFQKLDTAAMLKWKNENPEGYKKLVQ